MNHLVQFFETMKSEAEWSEPQKPEVAATSGFGPRIALLIRLFV